jgi:hypothetical protein
MELIHTKVFLANRKIKLYDLTQDHHSKYWNEKTLIHNFCQQIDEHMYTMWRISLNMRKYNDEQRPVVDDIYIY